VVVDTGREDVAVSGRTQSWKNRRGVLAGGKNSSHRKAQFVVLREDKRWKGTEAQQHQDQDFLLTHFDFPF
jgi:hypothetical protein